MGLGFNFRPLLDDYCRSSYNLGSIVDVYVICITVYEDCSLIYYRLLISDWIVFWWVEPLNYLIRENGRVKVCLIINQNFLYIDAAITGFKGIQGFLCSAKDRETVDFRHDVSVNLKACRARGRDVIPVLTKKTVVIYLINVCEIIYRYLRIVSDVLKYYSYRWNMRSIQMDTICSLWNMTET